MADVSEMDLLEKVDFVRSTVTPLDLADMFEIEVHGDKITSPFNEHDHTPSCHLYEDGWFDYSTGRHGDVIDLYMHLTKASFGKAVNRLAAGAERMDADPDRVRRVPKELPDLRPGWVFGHLPADPHLWAGRVVPILPVVFDFLNTYGQVGAYRQDPTVLAIAHWHDGKVRGIKLRSATGQKSAVPGSTFACGLYSPHVPTGGSTAVVAEGESDSWALMQAFGWMVDDPQVDIFALPSGAGLWKDAWLVELEQYDTIYTAFDNDRAGKQATEKVRSAVGWGRWRELKVPDLYNDVREAMAAGWVPKL